MNCSHTDCEHIFYIFPSYFQPESLLKTLILNANNKVYYPYTNLEMNFYFAPITNLITSFVELINSPCKS